MVTSRQSTAADGYHVVSDDHAFWQWHGAADETEARRQADQLAADPHAGCTTVWLVPCGGASCAICAAFTSGSEHADDVFPAIIERYAPHWRRQVTPQ